MFPQSYFPSHMKLTYHLWTALTLMSPLVPSWIGMFDKWLVAFITCICNFIFQYCWMLLSKIVVCAFYSYLYLCLYAWNDILCAWTMKLLLIWELKCSGLDFNVSNMQHGLVYFCFLILVCWLWFSHHWELCWNFWEDVTIDLLLILTDSIDDIKSGFQCAGTRLP